MLEFKIRKTINAPYHIVWEMAGVAGNVQGWAPVSFQNITGDVALANGLKLKQEKLFMGLSARPQLEVSDFQGDSIVRRQFSFSMFRKRRTMNRITFLFDDFSAQTFLDLYETRNRETMVFEEGTFDPDFTSSPLDDFTVSINKLKNEIETGEKYEVRITAHVYYDLGQTMWGSLVEKLFVNTFLLRRYRKNVEDALERLKGMSESEFARRVSVVAE